jgi:hypothetical protein
MNFALLPATFDIGAFENLIGFERVIAVLLLPRMEPEISRSPI